MSVTRLARCALGIAAAAALCFAATAPAAAQTTSASVGGAVADSQGGMLPGATVTLTSKTQGNSFTATTDKEGRFVFPIVRPDAYSLKVTLQGFKTLERTNVVVNANDRLSAGTLTLEVGALTESVSVDSRVSELQAESGERSFSLEAEAIKNIASNGRQLFNYALLVPGVVSTDSNAGNERGDAESFSVNGQRQTSNNVTIDGVANIDTGNNGGNMVTTNTEAIGEFKILTNSYQAEYGRAVGGQVQMVTKSGTQEFHGSGYWFGRRSDWNANTWTNLRSGDPAFGGKVIEPPKASRDNYGFTIGGPLYIPGVFNEDKKKLFFFWSEEGQQSTNPPSQHTARVPTDLERQGNFSQSVDQNGNPMPWIRDYSTGLPCVPTASGDHRGCFQSGGVMGVIPANRLYAPGLAALSIYPEPNYSVAGSNVNYTSQASDSTKPREDLIRLDFQASDKWRITGRYMHTNADVTQAYGTPWAGNGSYQIPMPVLFLNPSYNYMGSVNGIINTTTSLEVSVGTAHNSLNYQLQDPSLFRKAANLTGMPLLYPNAVQADYIPWFQWGGGNTANGAEYQTDRGPFTNSNTTWDVVANLTKVWGQHSSKFGIYYQHSTKPQSIFYSFNSAIQFNQDPSNPYDTGFSYANAATGVFDTYTQTNKYSIPNWVYKNIEWYAQDNWKASRKLTLDYGVRFYYLTPQWDNSLSVSNFLPDKYVQGQTQLYTPAIVNGVKVGLDPATGQTVDARFIGRLTPESNRFNGAFTAGQGISNTVQSGNAFRVSPRLGAVYDISGSGSTIIRGGFAIFYDRPMGNINFDMGGNAPSVLNSTLTWGTLQNLGGGGSSDPNPPLGMAPTAYDFTPPKVYSWNVGVQHKLPYKLVFDIAYVGSSSKDLLRHANINTPPLGATFQPQNQDPTLPASTNGSSALPTDFLRPYVGYGDINMYDYTGFSNYQSVQTSIQRRFDKGFMFTVYYVWSKTLTTNNDDYAGGVPYGSDPAKVRAYDYSYGPYDRPSNFVVNFIYQTPKVTDSGLKYLVNNWQISGVYRLSNGVPYAINYSIPGVGNANLSGTSNPAARIVLNCNPGSGHSSNPYDQIANASCFAEPQQGSLGNESARFFLHGPGTNNLDLSLSKIIPVGNRVKMEVRLDAFNALNHTQFTGVNNTVNFDANGNITNLPYDSSGKLVHPTGIGTISGVANPRTLQLVTRLTF
ncbi:MAG TPA: carboxypeptidase regulatory-like domain-containing protein [Vicinamibacteria bacterium]|nr:carboxypeptidase regulatory-like domain-containing protein [Vicinamibacteria bacterium]